jgi:hypothetical protein
LDVLTDFFEKVFFVLRGLNRSLVDLACKQIADVVLVEDKVFGQLLVERNFLLFEDGEALNEVSGGLKFDP